MEEQLRVFMKNPSAQEANRILKSCVEKELYKIGFTLGQFFALYYKNPELLNELGICAFKCGEVNVAYECFYLTLQMNISFELAETVQRNKCEIMGTFENVDAPYPKDIVERLKNKEKKPINMIVVSITTCKRFDLFSKTMNSFLSLCADIDLVDQWLVVDDNSTEEDRKLMQIKYPFCTFYLKTKEEKGHAKSMNIIRELVTKKYNAPFLFHMEDDWKFLEKRPYISECLEILTEDESYGQCLINRNYAELSKDMRIVGGEWRRTIHGKRYILHDFHENNPDKEELYKKKYGYGSNSGYWAHYSLRPSLLRTKIFDIGEYNEKDVHFEREYAYRYYQSGYRSAFLEGIYSIHIGRLTSERGDLTKLNAYDLNNETQFGEKRDVVNSSVESKLPTIQEEPSRISPNIEKIPIYIVNLDKRADRMIEMVKKINKAFHYIRFKAIDGDKLNNSERLQRLFEGNDYNMRRGMVGCALSHIQLWINLVESNNEFICILEDDTDFVPDFYSKLSHVLTILPKTWDLCYLGHHLWPKCRTEDFYDKTTFPTVQKKNKAQSFEESMGGTGGYLITKKGAKTLLEILSNIGITNGIDTMQQKCCDILNVYYCKPHLIYNPCWSLENTTVDSDIQKSYNGLGLKNEDRIALILASNDSTQPRILKEASVPTGYVSYKINEHTIIDSNKRLMKNEKYSIEDILNAPSQTDKTVYISFGNFNYVYEKLYNLPSFPFDTMDSSNLYKNYSIMKQALETTTENFDEFIKEFCSPDRNNVYIQPWNRKAVVQNLEFNVNFPHEENSSIEKIYGDRFRNLISSIRNKKRIVLVYGTRFPTETQLIPDILNLLHKYNSESKIVTINIVSDYKSDKFISLTSQFSSAYNERDWPPQKTHYDHQEYRPQIHKLISEQKPFW